jgi:hypothetical protein
MFYRLSVRRMTSFLNYGARRHGTNCTKQVVYRCRVESSFDARFSRDDSKRKIIFSLSLEHHVAAWAKVSLWIISLHHVESLARVRQPFSNVALAVMAESVPGRSFTVVVWDHHLTPGPQETAPNERLSFHCRSSTTNVAA